MMVKTSKYYIFSDQKKNLQIMQEIGLTSKLLFVMQDMNASRSTMQTVASVLMVLLSGGAHTPSLLKYVEIL